MLQKKNDHSPVNSMLKTRRDIKHISFFKQKITGLSPLNKLSPFKEIQQSTKQYSSVDFTKPKQPLFNSMNYRSKPKNLLLTDVSYSPTKSHKNSSYSSHQPAKSQSTTTQISQTKRQEQKVPFDSLKSQNIYRESQQCIQQTIKSDQKHEDLKIIQGLKSLIKKEKQVILNDVDQITKLTEKIQQKTQSLSTENEGLKKQFQNLSNEGISSEQYDSTISKYNKIIQLLTELSINYETLLPELKNEQQIIAPHTEENKDETILLQQFVIKKLVNQIEESKQQNQQLLQRIKQ